MIGTKESLPETLRVRTSKEMKLRVKRIASRRGCDSADVVREAVLQMLSAEEQRLGISEEKKG